MKKTILILCLISACSIISQAQVTIKPAVGFNYMHFNRSTGNWDRSGGIGYHLGSSVIVGKQFYFEGGAFWLNNFSEYSQIDGPGGPVRVEHQLTMLRVPIYGGYTIVDGESRSTDFRVTFGPVFNIPIQVNNSITNVNAPTSSDYNQLIWGANLGLSVAYWWVFADLGYELDFNEVFNNTTEFGTAKASFFTVNIGVRVRL